ncbi:MAG: hypothetical protein HY289_06170 [Planctomycetes bacterium]|nr:hypothetical protein [Planctomycetota bacterium]
MHQAYRDFILARVQAAVGAAKAARGVSHSGLRGEIREILIRDLFRPLLPADVGVGSGEIISHTNQTSKQTDIVLYDRSILPPIVFQEAAGIFPVEAVLYAIEVKSKLTSQELRDSDSAARKLEQLEYSAGQHDLNARPINHFIKKAVPVVFALASDLTGHNDSEIERYDGLREAGEPAIRGICVAGRNYWFWSLDAWRTWPVDYEFAEVISFIGTILNTYREVAETRGQPRLGRYLIDG